MKIEPEEMPIGERMQTDPGVVVERRCFLKLAALALGAVAIPGRPAIRVGTTGSTLTVEEFVAEVVPVAKALVADTSLAGQDRYLLTLAAFSVRLGDVPEPELRARDEVDRPTTYIGVNGAWEPFVMLHWKMDPGSSIERHAHNYGNVVTLGLTGAAWVENFEVVGERDYNSSAPIQVRRTVNQWLTPHSTNLVNLQRNYSHGFRAGRQGASGLDLTTRIKERALTPYLVLGDRVQGEEDVFDAHWDLR